MGRLADVTLHEVIVEVREMVSRVVLAITDVPRVGRIFARRRALERHGAACFVDFERQFHGQSFESVGFAATCHQTLVKACLVLLLRGAAILTYRRSTILTEAKSGRPCATALTDVRCVE